MLGLTQTEMARLSGTTQSAIAAYESTARVPKPETLRRILGACGYRPSLLLAARRDQVVEIARRHKAHNVRLFGSAARGEDNEDSDLDFLVTFDRGASLLDQAGLVVDLSDLFGFDVDVVSEGGLHQVRHRAIIDEAVLL